MYCIVCNRNNIKPSGLSAEEEVNETEHLFSKVERERGDGQKWTETTNNRMWNGGIVHIIDAGFGSIHDTDRFIIAICDECITYTKEEATLLYYGNYMSPDARFVQEGVKESKKKFNRRNNLDNLI